MKTTFQIYSSNESLFNEITDLYISAFPSSERRSIQDFGAILESDHRFCILAATLNGTFAGFISYWTFADFVYVEHLAIVESIRGKGMGSYLINQLGLLHNSPIVLEVEPDTDSITHKRIEFYNRLGFAVRRDVHYIQPPYSPDKDSLELWLMTNNSNTSTEELSSFANTIKKEVYFSHY